MTEEKHYDAILTNWRWSVQYPDSVIGIISEDKKNRFHNGEQVTTSSVISVDKDFYATTRNSVYKLENPA